MSIMQRSKTYRSFNCSTFVITVFVLATGACQLDDENAESMDTGTQGTLTTTLGTTTGQNGTTGGTTSETGMGTGTNSGTDSSTGSGSTTGMDPSTSGSTGATTGSDTDSTSTSATGSTGSDTSSDSSTTNSTSSTSDSGESTSSESSSDETDSDTTDSDSGGGKLGTSCENAADCESHLVCADLLPNLASTCSECGPKDKCKDPLKKLCSPTWNPLINKNPYYACVGPKSLKSGAVCLPEGSGPEACKDFCVEMEGFKSLGVCGECRPGESDCPPGEECSDPSFSPPGIIIGSKCEAL